MCRRKWKKLKVRGGSGRMDPIGLNVLNHWEVVYHRFLKLRRTCDTRCESMYLSLMRYGYMFNFLFSCISGCLCSASALLNIYLKLFTNEIRHKHAIVYICSNCSLIYQLLGKNWFSKELLQQNWIIFILKCRGRWI